MSRTHDLTNVRDGVGGSKERSIQPPSALADEFWQSFRYVRLADGAFDVFQDPEYQR